MIVIENCDSRQKPKQSVTQCARQIRTDMKDNRKIFPPRQFYHSGLLLPRLLPIWGGLSPSTPQGPQALPSGCVCVLPDGACSAIQYGRLIAPRLRNRSGCPPPCQSCAATLVEVPFPCGTTYRPRGPVVPTDCVLPVRSPPLLSPLLLLFWRSS